MDLVTQAEEFSKRLLSNESTGHDFFHACRVRNIALALAEGEELDIEMLQVAALLHDIDDLKVLGTETPRLPGWLEENCQEKKEKILAIVNNISYSKGKIPDLLEGQIVQDADRIEALGALGIARCFAMGQKFGNPIHDPAINPGSTPSTSINHFSEKLFKLKGLMNTQKGRALAQEREDFMKRFLEQFFLEWEGSSQTRSSQFGPVTRREGS